MEATRYSLRIHHYTGSKETFYARIGRKAGNWEDRNNYEIENNDFSMRRWVREFMTLMGSAAKVNELTVQARKEAMAVNLELVRRWKKGEAVEPYRKWDEWENDWPPMEDPSEEDQSTAKIEEPITGGSPIKGMKAKSR